MIKSLFARNIYSPLYCRLYRRDHRLKYYKIYRKAQWNSIEKNREIQADKLFRLINYATKNIPHYKRIAKEITFSKDTIMKDIRKFPILTKETIKKEFDNLNVPQRGIRWYNNTSGGSTGEPVKFIQDFNYEAKSSAFSRLMDEWAGLKLGDTTIHLWGSVRDIMGQTDKFRHRFANWMKSTSLLNTFEMDKQKMKEYVEFINKKKPTLILAYTTSIYELSKFIEKEGLKIYSPKSIMTSAGTLFPHFRKVIERAFGSPVFNRYGSREAGNMACECSEHNGLHQAIFTHYIEILNENLDPCKENECGEIYVTLLNNYTMPLIRYKIGDMGIYTEKECPCGRGLPMIKNVTGRSNDLFITKKGGLIHTFAINSQFYYKDFIKRYQVIQKSTSKIIIKIMLNDSEKNHDYHYDDKIEQIRNNISKIMGGCSVECRIVENINSTNSGKYRYTIREF